jgi:hypothetical protein
MVLAAVHLLMVCVLLFDFKTSDDDTPEVIIAISQDRRSDFISLQHELEDLSDWANDLIDEAFGVIPVPRIPALQFDMKPFHKLLD